MYPWCVEELLALSRLDIKASLSLYRAGFYPHAFFYLYQSLEKLAKALLVLGKPEEIKKKVEKSIKKRIEEGIKSFDFNDILCFEVMKFSVGHGAAWKLIEWMRKEYQEITNKISAVLSNKTNDEQFIIAGFLDALDLDIVPEEFTKFYKEYDSAYASIQKIVEDKYREATINGKVVDLNKVFEKLGELSDIVFDLLNTVKDESVEEINIDDLGQLFKTNMCYKLENTERGKKFLDLVRYLAEKQGSDPDEAIQGLCRALPCIYMMIIITLKKLIDIYKVFVLIPLIAFLDRVKAHEFSRYPLSRNVSPLRIEKEHLDKIKFTEISSLVVDAIDSFENYLRIIKENSKFLTKCIPMDS